MGRFTRDELARRAGVPGGFVDRAVELGILRPDHDTSFSMGDVHRARFAHGLEQGGVPLPSVASAVQSGVMSFGFFDASYWERFAGLSRTTYRELSADTGLPVELLASIGSRSATRAPVPTWCARTSWRSFRSRRR
ncbi:MAG TPA: hypothetical protein VE646_10755 [Actinomycetota bacterium]|jgi:hypothetical protein|nr:hypothetical protein [Actinomycetota bacterium]